jgi:6-phosphogluconate dehydrogenase
MKRMKTDYDIGMIGLGVMGRNLALNMIDHGFSVAGYDRDPNKIKAIDPIYAVSDIQKFIRLLRRPRAIMLLVPAGAPVDAVIKVLLPHLHSGDLIIDAGNSYFKDTDIRTHNLIKRGIHFMGVGISGGEEGARHGPSIMPGGSFEAYERVRPIFEAVAAKVNNEPCVTYVGSGSAGHFVKMVHNGIEYGMMQLIAETYDLMKRGLGLNNDELHNLYSEWNAGKLNSYLIEITSQIFSKEDEKTGNRLIDEILDVARQNGTGMWTSQSAMELQVPIPTIDAAVMMRDLSILKQERQQASKIYSQVHAGAQLDKTVLHDALYIAMIITYAQGFALLSAASKAYQYQINLAGIARIWRGGCIIRARLLDDIQAAYAKTAELSNLLLHPAIAEKITHHEKALRDVVCTAAECGLPAPGLMSALSYLDSYRSAWLPANLIQAQRDYFGAHTYERIDAQGTTIHTEWESHKA